MTNQEKNLIVKMAVRREREVLIKLLEVHKEVKNEDIKDEVGVLMLELTNHISVLDEAMGINIFPEVDVEEIKNSKYVTQGGVDRC